ncbi:MAG TPA: zinc-binding dehydrogenase [Lentisphaeria bacterium]|nr:MAG: hypothetical protein A2X48_22565 [Lentisphaerae bacterium GWF2_49_21]HBC89509.1 zinc-binding dehydrogenase [Lentisphaeria bacterium]
MKPYEKAKLIVFERPGCVKIVTGKMPGLTDDSIVIETVMSGISLGTEMKLYRGLSCDKAPNVWYPMVPGYESVGSVLHVGSKAIPQDAGYIPQVGDRVMVNEIRFFPEYCAAWGGQTGLAIKNSVTARGAADGLSRIPDDVSYEQAVCAYLSSVALKGVKRLNPKDGETILVTGCGQVGLSAIQLSKAYANCKVIAMDNMAVRAKRAKPFADFIVDASSCDPVKTVREITEGRGVDAIDECSGNPDIIDTLKFYLKDGGWKNDDEPGRIHLQGDYPRPIILSSYENWFCTNATITMTCATAPGCKTEILKLISQGKLKVAWGPIYDVDDAPRAYSETDKNYFDTVKPVFKWK